MSSGEAALYLAAVSSKQEKPHGPSFWNWRELAQSKTHGPSPAPAKACLVSGGQCTKSHCFSGRSWPSTISTPSPWRTRKSSASVSQWYVPDGSPGCMTRIAIPSIGKNVSASYSS